MIQYLEILEEIFDKGTPKPPARENMPSTISRFSIQKRFDMADGFPLLTTKKVFSKGMIHELIWFLKGDTNIYYLHKNNVRKFWHEDAYKFYLKTSSKEDTHVRTFEEWFTALDDENYAKNYGKLGMIYSHQWRNFTNIETTHKNHSTSELVGGIDQIEKILENIKNNPASRYHVVTAWNPGEVGAEKAALPPCHMLFMFNCRPMTIEQRFEWAIEQGLLMRNYVSRYTDGHGDKDCDGYLDSLDIPTQYLDLDLTQRSADSPLGVPINIASYALLLHIFAKLTNMVAGEFIWCGKDVHIYENQIKTAKIQLAREPRKLPELKITGNWKSIDDIKYENFEIVGYDPYPILNYPLSTGIIKNKNQL